MMLLAMAAMFGALGYWSLGDDDEASAAVAPTAVATTTPPPVEKPAAAAAPTTTAAPSVDKAIPVGVYNNSDVSGLAAETAGQLEADGWTVAETGGWTEVALAKTTVYFGPTADEEAAAEAISTLLGARTAPKLADMPGPEGAIVVVVVPS
jgi:hypothetical protein